MRDSCGNYVVCPYCGAQITQLTFEMIDTREVKFSESKIMEIELEIESLRDELESSELDMAQKLICKNEIEHLELQLKDPVSVYKERVYHCPECRKILSIVPAQDLKQVIDLLTSAPFDDRDLS